MGIAAILQDKGSEVVTVGPDSSISEIIAELTARRIGAVLVMTGESVVGVVSERDVVRGLAAHRGDVLSLKAKEIMTAPVITISPADSVPHAMELMTGRRIRHLPVMESGRLVGLVSIGDLVKRRIEEVEQEASALKDYISAG
ncbi:CBS domain-containing protein [Sandaracinobacteroides sp. A072]|uniref:CBS domain-containing protein n=1 Tax=Sandaracinobacteroides sp. A072 TaxID=3461146 RepID=UPI004042B1BB